MFKSYIAPDERQEADRSIWRLMGEGLLLGGSGLGVLALIFEIAADAFSVAAYQTLLAIHGASGYHEIAVAAFILLSVLLFFGIVPAYKAGAYLRPDAGGSGPLVEAIGPSRLRPLSWVGTSLFFLDAVLTIIISSISAADVTMLLLPEWAPYRILLAELFAFFIMAVLVALGPKRAVPLFLIGGGAFTLFTLAALSIVGYSAVANPEWAFLTEGIVRRLEETGVVSHVEQATAQLSTLSTVTIFQFFFRSMSSAMLGFSGYEVIPASGKHAARPKWKVINTALTLAAVFLIGTGVLQLLAAQRWKIPATEGYSTLLIEYEIVASQALGEGVDPDAIVVTDEDRNEALVLYDSLIVEDELFRSGGLEPPTEAERSEQIEEIASTVAFNREIQGSLDSNNGIGQMTLTLAGVLLAIILLLAQGGGYVGGAAVAANAARLGRLPRFFSNDRIGIAVIWGAAAILIPVIREVVIVESYYAFGFVSAFIITSTTVFFVRDDVLIARGIPLGSGEARSLKFAGLRGMVASYIMGVVLVTQKTDALVVIVIFGVVLTLLQIFVARGGFGGDKEKIKAYEPQRGVDPVYLSGIQRAHDEARQRGVVDRLNDLIHEGAMVKFNLPPNQIRRLASYLHNVSEAMSDDHDGHARAPEPSLELESTYLSAYGRRDELLDDIEFVSHYGIFTFIDKYYHNWVNNELGRDAATVQRAMLSILFPKTDPKQIWEQYKAYEWIKQPEPVWQFARDRYNWAKDQWPNLSDRITTVWTLQELGLVPVDIDVETVIAVNERNQLKKVDIHLHPADNQPTDITVSDTDSDLGGGAHVHKDE